MEETSPEKWTQIVPKRYSRLKRPSQVGKTAKTRVHKLELMKIFLSPPEGFDGSNKKLAGYLGLSERQISRLIKMLEVEGRVKLDYVLNRTSQGGVYTTRFIHIQKGSK